MEALGASHLKLYVSGRRERGRLGFVVRRKGVGGGGVVSFRANCLAASISSASSSQKNHGSEEIQRVKLDQPRTVRVKFKLQRQCEFGEQFLVVGDDPNLGLWDPLNGVPLVWSEGHVWTAEVDVPSSKVMSYKFVLEEIDGTVSWQPGPDRVLETWDTAKVISVSEDWESPDFQEVVEEEFVSVSSLLVAESVNQSLVEGGNGVMEEEVDDSSLGLLVNGTLNGGVVEVEDDVTKEDGGGNGSRSDYSEDPLMLMVAENISEVEESSESNETTSSFKSETELVMDEEAPALVPGLAALSLKEVEVEEAETETEASRNVRSTTTAADEISVPIQKKNSIVEDAGAEFDETKDSSAPTFKKSSIVEDTATEFDETKDSSAPTYKKSSIVVDDTAAEFDETRDSSDPMQKKNSIVEDSAAELYEIDHSSDPTRKKNSIVEDAAAEFYEIKDSSDHNQRNNDVFEDAATKFDEIEGSIDLDKRNDDILEDTATQPEAASEPEIGVSAALHCAETSETRVAEETTRRPEGKKLMLDIDMQWGRRTLHKFLANLGFMQHS